LIDASAEIDATSAADCSTAIALLHTVPLFFGGLGVLHVADAEGVVLSSERDVMFTNGIHVASYLDAYYAPSARLKLRTLCQVLDSFLAVKGKRA
jgi:hypothetical protein